MKKLLILALLITNLVSAQNKSDYVTQIKMSGNTGMAVATGLNTVTGLTKPTGALQYLRSNAANTGFEFATVAGGGTVTSVATTSPITGGTITTTGTIGINNAAADGSTKGAASFTANDFNSSTGNISLDYTNAQAASSGQNGFLSATDWSTFNNKQSAITPAALTKVDDTNVTLTLTGTPTTALLQATGLTLGWSGILSGARGGTGVNNSGKTITLGGNFATSGAFATTLTVTNTTNVTLPTTGTLATLAGTETLTNKSIDATQLTGTAYTIPANNTNSTAAYTLQAYQDVPVANYIVGTTGTITWDGSVAPSSATSIQYAWSRIGNTVTLVFGAVYSSSGTGNTLVNIDLPIDCPAPINIAGLGSNANEKISFGTGSLETNPTSTPSVARCWLSRNSAGTGYAINIKSASASVKVAQFTISYRVN